MSLSARQGATTRGQRTPAVGLCCSPARSAGMLGGQVAVARWLSPLETAVPLPVSPPSWAKGAWQTQGQAWGAPWLGATAGHIHTEALSPPVSQPELERRGGLVFLWAQLGRVEVPACPWVRVDGVPLPAPLGSWGWAREMCPTSISHTQPRQHPPWLSAPPGDSPRGDRADGSGAESPLTRRGVSGRG